MKKILFITHLNPFKTSFGAEQRTNIALMSLIKCNYNVDIAYLGNIENQPISYKPNMRIVFWNKQNTKSYSILQNISRLLLLNMFPFEINISHKLQEIIELNSYDYIYCRYLQFAALANLSRYHNKLLLDIDDMPVQALQIDFARKKGLKKIYFNLLKKAYIRDTKKWIRKTHTCFVPNKKQAEDYGISFLPNISQIWDEYKKPSQEESLKILFIGKLDWNPNLQGLERFLYNCWHDIKKELPDVELLIAGKGLDVETKDIWEEKFPSVKVLGFVEDIKDFYRSGNIVICPIYSGAGTNIKIIEAMSMSKPVIVSRESTKGYEDFLRHNQNCLIASNDNEFTKLIISLLKDSKRQMNIAKQANIDAKEIYSFENICRILSETIEK